MPRQRLSDTDKQVLKDARALVKWLDAEKLALVNPDKEPIQPTTHREGSVPKKHRAGQLLEYNAIEALVELRNELRKHNAHLPRVYTLYLYLRRIVNA